MENESIWYYRLYTNQVITPIDLIYGKLSFKLDFKEKIALMLSIPIFIPFLYSVKYMIVYFILSFYFWIFYYFNIIIYNLITRGSKSLEIDIWMYNTTRMSLSQITYFYGFKIIQARAFASVYFILSKKKKQLEIEEFAIRFLFRRILHIPFWAIVICFDIFFVIETVISQNTWSEKKVVAWIPIFFWDLKYKIPFRLNWKHCRFIFMLDRRKIIIEEGNIRTNSLAQKIAESFLFWKSMQSVKEIKLIEHISMIVPIPHRFILFSKERLQDPSKLAIGQSYTSKDEIIVKGIKLKTLGDEKQHYIITAIPEKLIKKKILTRFEEGRPFMNEWSYAILKTCEKFIAIEEGERILIGDKILIQKTQNNVWFDTYKNMKKGNLNSVSSCKYIEEELPRSREELEIYIKNDMGIVEDVKILANKALKILAESALDIEERQSYFINALLSSNLTEEEKTRILKELDKKDSSWYN